MASPGWKSSIASRIRELEPHAAGIRGLWSPRTGVIDFRRVALAMAAELRAGGAEIRTGHTVSAIDVRPSEVVVTTGRGDVTSRLVVTCAGLQADRVAALSGDTGGPSIVPFRGDYYTLSPQASGLVRGLIYPVPDPRFPFLGVHFHEAHRRVGDRGAQRGPRVRARGIPPPGRRRTRPAGCPHRPRFPPPRRPLPPTGIAELWRDWSKAAFVGQLQRYVPGLGMDQVTFGPSGVRAQALARNGTLVDDFAFSGGPRVLHVRNAPSPAATSSLAIGSVLADEALSRLDAA
jgi:L-2-hydroxyglutarate oxidase LhgO